MTTRLPYMLPRPRHFGSICETCGHPLAAAQDPGDDGFPGPLEIWCPDERDCEHPGCMVCACGDAAPQPCALCGFRFCSDHLQLFGDAHTCSTCHREASL